MAKELSPFQSDRNEFFNLRPVTIGGFKLRARSAIPVGRPSLAGWTDALGFAVATNDASPFWIGDLVAYADTRAEWRDKLDQAIALTGLKRHTLHNLGYISRRLQEPERVLAPSLAHAQEVAPLDSSEQAQWLEKAKTEGYTVRELRREMRAARRKKVLEGQATLEGMYRVVYAAPDWSQLAIEELCRLPVAAHVAPSAVLFLWVPAPRLLQNPGPREVIESWGFEYKTGGVWDRVLPSFGSYLEITHEHLIIATRGDCQPDAPTPAPRSIYVERRTSEHGEKPRRIRGDWIEKLYTRGPYLELFGREPVEGWSVFGSDATKWAEQAAQEAAIA